MLDTATAPGKCLIISPGGRSQPGVSFLAQWGHPYLSDHYLVKLCNFYRWKTHFLFVCIFTSEAAATDRSLLF